MDRSGDISNEVAPRIVFVFEGLIGVLQHEGKFKLFAKARAWDRALAQYQAVEHVQKILWDITTRYHYSCDVVSYLPLGAKEALRSWLDERGYPYGQLIVTTLPEMTRTVVSNPSVYFVYEPNPKRSMAYGGKSVFVPNPQKLGF